MKKPKREKRADAKRHRAEVDTNVFQVSMACLKDAQIELATGDPCFCKGCKSIFNNLSKREESKEGQSWLCEFCNHKNEIDLDDEEVPQTSAVNYII